MTNPTPRRTLGSLLAVASLCVGMAACDLSDILDVQDPDLVTPDNVTGPNGAELFWAGALGRFGEAYTGGGGGQAVYVGMFTDEFHLSGTFPTRNEVDRREIDIRNGTMEGQYRVVHEARVAAENAVPLMEEFFSSTPRVAEMLNLAGFTYIFFGENYCSGVPYGESPPEGDVIQGTPTTTTETFERAIARFDEALAKAGGSADQERMARVGKARALLNLDRPAEAASVVASVPTDWAYFIRHKGNVAFNQQNAVFEMNHDQRRWSLSDMEGGNGVAFRSQEDARVPWFFDGQVGFDEETPLFLQERFPSWDTDVELTSGIEARLIEAEALLRSGNGAGAVTALNDLRATVDLDPVADPGGEAGRVDLLFEERARWLFGTAHRLGDLRRLIRQYGRTQDQVFPSGDYFKGGTYGSDVNFPIPFEETENENFEQCLDRNA